MAGLLQTVKPVAASNNALQATTPVKTKVGNKKVTPVNGFGAPRNSDGSLRYTTQPVQSPIDRYKKPTNPGSVQETGKVTFNPSSPKPTSEAEQPPMIGDPVDWNKPRKPTSGSGNGSTPSFETTSVGSIDLPEINPEEIDVRDAPQGYDEVEGKEYDYEADLKDSSSVEKPGLTEESSVAERLTGLLSQDNPYIQQARQQAAEAAAARGLRNSTMGVQAGQEAAIKQALPIAQQDAQQAFELDRMGYENDLQGIRDQNLSELDKEKMTLQQEFTQDLEQLRYRQQQGMMDRESELKLRELERNAQLTQQRDLLLQQMQERTDTMRHAQQLQQMQKDFEYKMKGLSAELDHQNRLNYANAANQAQVAAMEQIGMMYQNPNMTPEQQRNAVDGIYDRLEQTYRSLESVYGSLPGVDIPEKGTDGVDDGGNSGRPGGGRDTIVRPPGGGGGGGRPGGGGGRNERRIQARV